MSRISASSLALFLGLFSLCRFSQAQELPAPSDVAPQKLAVVPHYCEGVVFDHAGNGYVSEGKRIVLFTRDGNTKTWVETGAPNGHKVLADGTHLVCDASHHAVLHLSADGKMLPPASRDCGGKMLRGPNDLTLDVPHAGFYFSDPGDSDLQHPIGTVHYVDAAAVTHLVDDGLAFPNGIVLTPDGKKLYLAESQKNRVLVYDVVAPGKVGARHVLAELPRHPSGDLLKNQPDGMCLDAAGNLYVAHYGMKQVQVLSPAGKLLAGYDGGNVTTSNVAFGGPNMDQLFVTGGLEAEAGRGGLFRLDLGVKGLVILPPKAEQADTTKPIPLFEVSNRAHAPITFASLIPETLRSELIGKSAVPLNIEAWANGTPLAPEELKGKVVLLDFWAVWCGPCRATFPHLRQWQEKYSPRGLVIIGLTRYCSHGWSPELGQAAYVEALSPQAEQAAMERFAQYHQLKHRLAFLSADSEEPQRYGVRGIPQIVLIDQQGTIRMIRVGATAQNMYDIEMMIEQLLSEPVALSADTGD